MTLPNNFSTKNKLSKIWEQTEINRISVDIQKSEQRVIITELNKSQIRTFDNNQIIDLTTDYIIPIIQQSSAVGAEIILQNWEFNITGLTFDEMIGYRTNLLVKFGAAETIIADNIRPVTNLTGNRKLLLSNYISTNSLIDDRTNNLILYVGFYLQDFNGIQEFNTQEMKVALNLTFINPRYYN